MSEDNKDQVIEEKEVIEEVVQEVNPAEATAREHGWKPKEEWEGDPDDWVSYKEFNRRGELFARIAKYGHELKENREALKKLFVDQRKLYDAGYAKALAELKQQKMQAAEEGDARRMLLVDEEIDNLKENHQKVQQEFQVNERDGPAPNIQNQVALEQWASVNPWYTNDVYLRQEADTIAKAIVESARSQGKNVEFTKLLNEVSRQVKGKFPDKFPRSTTKTSSVEGGTQREVTASSARGTRFTLDKIPAEEREIAKVVMQSSGLSEEEYVKQYMKASGGR